MEWRGIAGPEAGRRGMDGEAGAAGGFPQQGHPGQRDGGRLIILSPRHPTRAVADPVRTQRRYHLRGHDLHMAVVLGTLFQLRRQQRRRRRRRDRGEWCWAAVPFPTAGTNPTGIVVDVVDGGK